MSFKLGLAAKLYRNSGSHASPTWVEMANVKDLTLNLETGEADVTTRANGGWRAIVATLKDGSIEFEMVWDTADAAFTAVKDAFFNNTTLEMAVMDGVITTAGSEGLRAAWMITKFSRSEPLEEAITVSVTAKVGYSAFAPQYFQVAA